MRCVYAQNYESERDSNISTSLSLSWFRAKTQRIPDTWDGTLMDEPPNFVRFGVLWRGGQRQTEKPTERKRVRFIRASDWPFSLIGCD